MPSRNQDTDTDTEIRKAAIFRHIPREELRGLVDRFALREFSPGQTVFEQGDDSGNALLVLEGRVAIRQKEGEAIVDIASVGPCEWLGVTSLVDGEAQPAAAVAQEHVRALEVGRDEFLSLVASHPQAGMDLMKILASRARAGFDLLEQIFAERPPGTGAEGHALHQEEVGSKAVEAFVGSSVGAQRMRNAAIGAAAGVSQVLLCGEAGTGKSLLARCIHAASDRASGPFLILRCGLFSDTILESELFGHARGSLPGTMEDKLGIVEAADGGSLLLEDIGDMPRSLQGVVLRFLEFGEFHRLGETQVRQANVRIFSTISMDLNEAQSEGRIRRDLFNRLDIARIEIPPLRDRLDDVPLLISILMRDIAKSLEVEPLRLAPSALGVLSRYSFPGNVDELASEIKRLLITLEPGSAAGLFDLSPRFVSGDPAAHGHYSKAVRAFKAQLISSAIAESGGNYAVAAERLGLHRSNLSRMIRDLELGGLV